MRNPTTIEIFTLFFFSTSKLHISCYHLP
jgi:hypothetical protein